MNSELQQITQWLNGCKGQSLHIQKREANDLDETHIQLEQVTVANDYPDRRDDYVSRHELILHGRGYIVNSNPALNVSPPLPRDRYEIPLLGNWRGQVHNEMVQLMTDRASYEITRQPFNQLE
ncbi:hypothetical protein [Paenibacillus xerothermodurans]|uniref:Uncharacterized protein n=1 Tax=Paenibacillus xerothermodurans TaxID=1977292 RepID=A0A2W1NEP5_PAEXE|nr:hypothetical protein [Paenibacillus xerothermodurans]PZE22120.1 hypothetical protein CBW46_006970 [Paenibacillus xerothermodurans]